jgi:Arabinose-binding domain of AraC transcription regulator, N-term
MKGSPQSEASHPPFLWTRGIAAREVLHHLDRNGVDAEPLLAEAELSRSQVTQELGGISFVSQQRFLELAAVKTNDSLIGLHTAAEMDLRDAGILFYLAAASLTVAEGAPCIGLRGVRPTVLRIHCAGAGQNIAQSD